MIVVVLTMILIMPYGQEPITVQRNFTNTIDCLAAAHKWINLNPVDAGGIGLAAGCSVMSKGV